MFFLRLFVFALMPGPLFAQNLELPTLDSLMLSIEYRCVEVGKAKLSEFEHEEKGSWMKYLPVVGLTYTANGLARPSVSFSTRTIYQVRNDKALRKAKVKSISLSNDLDCEELKQAVLLAVQNYKTLVLDYEFNSELMAIDSTLLDYMSLSYENGEIDPKAWLRSMRSYKVAEYEHQKKLLELERLRVEILLKSYYLKE